MIEGRITANQVDGSRSLESSLRSSEITQSSTCLSPCLLSMRQLFSNTIGLKMQSVGWLINECSIVILFLTVHSTKLIAAKQTHATLRVRPLCKINEITSPCRVPCTS